MKIFVSLLLFAALFSLNSGQYYQECRDVSENCRYFTNMCRHPSYINYMRKNCQSSCGFCTSSTYSYNNRGNQVRYGSQHGLNSNTGNQRRFQQKRTNNAGNKEWDAWDNIGNGRTQSSSNTQERRVGSGSNRMQERSYQQERRNYAGHGNMGTQPNSRNQERRVESVSIRRPLNSRTQNKVQGGG